MGNQDTMELLTQYVNTQDWEHARELADREMQTWKKNEVFWILNASIYLAEGKEREEYMCITVGLDLNPRDYELYYMLGEYYLGKNKNQAYLCFEQALFYCESEEDAQIIKDALENLRQSGECDVRKVSIVILSYNVGDILKECLRYIAENTLKGTYELIIVDNASSDGIAEWLETLGDIKLIENDTNRGYAEGCNQGIKIAEPENDILLLNNDTLLLENSLFWMRMGLYERDSVGAVGPTTNYAGNMQMVDWQCKTKQEYIDIARHVNLPLENAYENKLWLIGFAMLMKRNVIDQVGMLDTGFRHGNYEDNDLGLRITLGGYELLLCHNSFVFHYGGAAMQSDMNKYDHYMYENRDRINAKWNMDVTYFANPSLDLIAKIHHEPEEPIKVLEVGCGSGATLAKIRYFYPNSQTFGIELMENAARFGKYMSEIIVGDIEQMEIPYEEKSFDYIMFGDVLEHLRNPDRAIEKLKKYLKPTGSILASIPNIQNIGVIAQLFLGTVAYHDSGLLDRTHIHFFTRNEIERLFSTHGFKVKSWSTVSGVENTTEQEQEVISKMLELATPEEQEKLMIYQYKIEAVFA